jgi:hypothetical protein
MDPRYFSLESEVNHVHSFGEKTLFIGTGMIRQIRVKCSSADTLPPACSLQR